MLCDPRDAGDTVSVTCQCGAITYDGVRMEWVAHVCPLRAPCPAAPGAPTPTAADDPREDCEHGYE